MPAQWYGRAAGYQSWQRPRLVCVCVGWGTGAVVSRHTQPPLSPHLIEAAIDEDRFPGALGHVAGAGDDSVDAMERGFHQLSLIGQKSNNLAAERIGISLRLERY